MTYLISFSSTHSAMEAEITCEDNKLSCRLIPLPSEISAGCGLSLKCEVDDINTVTKPLQEAEIPFDDIFIREGDTWKKE